MFRVLVSNLKWGVTWGLKFALAFCLIVTIQWLLGGARDVRQAGVSYGAVVGAYIVGGTLAGLVLGFLRPWGHAQLGAIGMGLLIAAAVYAAGDVALVGFRWTTGDWVVGAVLVLVWGIGGAVGLYRVFTPSEQRRWR